MQQRVGLARAFATDADVLLMDEPFSALDPLIRSRLQDELLSLQARVHKTIVFVTHDMNEAMRLGNQITILEGGRIVQTGTATDIVTRPSSDYVAAFVQHINPLSVLTASMVMRPLSAEERGSRAAGAGDSRPTPVTGDCTLQKLIEIHNASAHPVLVADATGLIGVVDAAEIMTALGRHHGASSAT